MDLPAAEMAQDPLMNVEFRRDIESFTGWTAHFGIVEASGVERATGERLYRVRYDRDGDIQYFTKQEIEAGVSLARGAQD